MRVASGMPSSASASPSPPSASQSQNSATQPSPLNHSTDAANNINELLNVEEKKPDIADQFQDLDGVDSIEKFKKYETDYTRRLMAKYFSKKNLYGGNIFDEDTTIGDEIIKSSKWPCTRSFADPLKGFEDHGISSASTVDNHISISNGKHPGKKN